MSQKGGAEMKGDGGMLVRIEVRRRAGMRWAFRKSMKLSNGQTRSLARAPARHCDNSRESSVIILVSGGLVVAPAEIGGLQNALAGDARLLQQHLQRTAA